MENDPSMVTPYRLLHGHEQRDRIRRSLDPFVDQRRDDADGSVAPRLSAGRLQGGSLAEFHALIIRLAVCLPGDVVLELCNDGASVIGHTAHVTDTLTDLRATSDALLRDLDALGKLEELKRQVPANDPSLRELAAQVHEIAKRVLDHTATQKDLTDEVPANTPAHRTIETVRRSAAAILAEWRDVEQRAAQAAAGSAEATELRILSDRLREEYAAAFEDANTYS
jgi:hypothetical protein